MKEHNNMMIELCLEFLYARIPFITEAIFNATGNRADIYLPRTDEVYEIGVSEKELDSSKLDYPVKSIKFVTKKDGKLVIEKIR
jgi:hypothetical protein